MVANTPGILPKAGLVGSKLVYYPFTLPNRLNESATQVGAMNHDLVEGVTAALGSGLQSLEPRGPAKWAVSLLAKVHGSVQHSRDVAQRNKEVFWDPFGHGAEQVGRAIAGPGAYWYAKKAGIEKPTQDAIFGALNTGLFRFPTAEEMLSAKAPVTTPGTKPTPSGEAPAPEPVPEPAPAPAPAPAPGTEAPQGEVQVTAEQLAEVAAAQQAAAGAGELAA